MHSLSATYIHLTHPLKIHTGISVSANETEDPHEHTHYLLEDT